MDGKTITNCVVGPYPKDFLDFTQPKVTVTYEDGTEEVLFSFYHDEIDFRASEFIGLTKEEALELRYNKDVRYLQS